MKNERGRGKVLTKICKEPKGKVKEEGLNSNKECGHQADIVQVYKILNSHDGFRAKDNWGRGRNGMGMGMGRKENEEET